MPNFRSFGGWIGIITSTLGIVLVFTTPVPPNMSFGWVVVAGGAGFLWESGLMLLFTALRSQEVTRAVSVYYVHPVFVVILAPVPWRESEPDAVGSSSAGSRCGYVHISPRYTSKLAVRLESVPCATRSGCFAHCGSSTHQQTRLTGISNMECLPVLVRRSEGW